MPLSAGSGYEYSGSNIPAFLNKLWTLVEDKKYDELIAWDPSGYSFHVFDQTRFAREILPRFFKHNNMASFIRQLNMYGFRKVNSIEHGSLKNEKDDMEFHHPYFIRNKENYLEYIKRKVPAGAHHSTVKKEDLVNANNTCDNPDFELATQNNNNTNTNNNSNNNTNNHTDSNNTASSACATSKITNRTQANLNPECLASILENVKTMHDKQADVVDRLQFLKRENEALWKEIASLRQKHHHQQQIVNKLIHFLVHLVNPTTVGMKRPRPLMIDSHSTLTNINDNSQKLNDEINDISNEQQQAYTIDDMDEPTAKQMRIDPEYVMRKLNDKSSKLSKHHHHHHQNNGNTTPTTTTNKGVIINDITDNILKATLAGSNIASGTHSSHHQSDLYHHNNNHHNNNSQNNEDMDIKVPFIDLPVDSPTSNQATNDDEFLDSINSNIFLNTVMPQTTYIEENTSSTNTNCTDESSNGVGGNSINPIIDTSSNSAASLSTHVTSTNGNSSDGSALTQQHHNLQEQHNNSTTNGTTTTRQVEKIPSNINADPTDTTKTDEKHGGLLRAISSSQLLEHVESFQFDLNSIRELLNTNHNIDNTVLNTLFTSEQNHANLVNSHVDANGRIMGNELIQYEPANPDVLFTLDDVTDEPAYLNGALTKARQQQQHQQTQHQQQQQSASLNPSTHASQLNANPNEHISFGDDFILNDDFSDTALLLPDPNSESKMNSPLTTPPKISSLRKTPTLMDVKKSN